MKTTPDALATVIGQRVDLIDTPPWWWTWTPWTATSSAWPTLPASTRCAGGPTPRCTKSAELALLLQRAGAQGACVQKVSEAEALAAGGVLDITITNEVIAMPKLHRRRGWPRPLPAGAAAWAGGGQRGGHQRLAEAMAQSGSDAGMDVLVEIDVGQGRCGVPPGEAADGAGTGRAPPPAAFAGLRAYHGRAQHLPALPNGARPLRAPCRRLSHARPHRGRGCRAAGHRAPAPAPGEQAASGCMASCRRARSCSWTPTTPATNATPPSPRLSTPCSSRPR